MDNRSFPLDVIKIALGVFIGSLAALFTYEAIVDHRSPVVQSRDHSSNNSSSGKVEAQHPPATTDIQAPPRVVPPEPPQPQQAPPPPPPPKADADARVVEERQARDLKSAEDLKNAQELSARLEGERQQRRATAWAQFFQPSPVCRADPTTRPCADAHLAARKRFDAQYVDR